MHFSCTQLLTLFIGFLGKNLKEFAYDLEYKNAFHIVLILHQELLPELNLWPQNQAHNHFNYLVFLSRSHHKMPLLPSF